MLRRSVADVEAEVAAAKKAQRKAKLEARKELIRGRQQHGKAAISAKIAELKDKRPGTQPQRRDTTPSDKMKDQAETARADYDAHLLRPRTISRRPLGEPRPPSRSTPPCRRRVWKRPRTTWKPAAHKAEMEAAERGTQVRERIAQAHEHVSGQRQ